MIDLSHLKNACWNVRYRELQELLHKGEEERKAIVVFLEDRQYKQDLTFGEKKLLDTAKNYNVVKIK